MKKKNKEMMEIEWTNKVAASDRAEARLFPILNIDTAGNQNQRRRRKSKKLVTRVTKFLNSCEAKHKKSLAHHFTSSSCSTDINALHDAYGAYVQFSAFRSLFVINPSIILLIL